MNNTRKRSVLSLNNTINKNSKLDESIRVNLKLKDCLKKYKGIDKLYEWQIDCLRIPGVGREKNLIYSLPTSGGKTLVSEMLMFKHLTQLGNSVIFILPFVSIVQEKVKSLEPFGLDLDFLVEEYAGNKGHFPPKKHRRPSLFIATIEKGHSLINSIIETNQVERIGLIVIDEIHMIGDGSRRGANLELILLKFMHTFKKARIIGMSATLDNIDEISNYLSAELFVSDYRPVELKEYVKCGDTIYSIQHKKHANINEIFQFKRKLDFQCDKYTKTRDPDNITGLVTEVIPSKSCLIFCATKRNCETLVDNLCVLIPDDVLFPVNNDKVEKRKQLLDQMKLECGDICPLLNKSVERGIAYHHSGLTQEERKFIEEGFLDGVICVICCTSTLAAGVNLPARRVIIRSPYIGRGFITYSQYKQMTGRAGRAGYDKEGESFVILGKKDNERFSKIITESNSMCTSSLMSDNGNVICYFILSVLYLQMCKDYEQIREMFSNSLFHLQNPDKIDEIIKESLQQLIDDKFIKQIKSDDSSVNKDGKNGFCLKSIKTTEIGRAIVKGCIDISRVHDIYDELKGAEKCLNISTYLHMMYLVTPVESVDIVKPDWTVYTERYNALKDNEKLLANHLGVDEQILTRKMIGHKFKSEFVLNKFYLTLMLNDLWNERTTFWVSRKYKQARGDIQNLLNNAVTYSACLSNFVDEFESDLWAYKQLLPKFTTRLSYCVAPEILPLMQINGVKKGRAYKLFQSGYDTVAKISRANSKELIQVLFPINKKLVKQIVNSAKMIVQEKLESLSEEVNELIVNDENDSVIIIDDDNNENEHDENVAPTDVLKDSNVTGSESLISGNSFLNETLHGFSDDDLFS